MRKEIKFEHAWEVMKWLEENKDQKLYCYDYKHPLEHAYCWKTGHNLPTVFFCNSDGIQSTNYNVVISNLTYYIDAPPPEWYENIPEQGILCWLHKSKVLKPTLSLMVPHIKEFVSTEHSIYKIEDFTPVKYEDIKHLLVENQSG